ncbi:MarR family winged helix-turn-helix transcriptional regulator [Nocardia sp. NBC_01329]|uniref:MarR family winged helix-turn-helix transcriptional regulator n=1 Tax=Nocardia sp. NBC_01329 TaxID=2903594 RepID=UPI002E0FB3AF|nr:MarR family winged helix-turn-helix transcriptional regulator [Nocardia sp. NBC_01329]
MARDPYRLIGRIQQVSHSLRKKSDRLLIDSAGVTTAQAGILAVIADDPGCSQRDIARRLRLGESAVVAAVGRLLSAGLVERRVSDQDSRAVALFLTGRGVETVGRAQETYGVVNGVVLEALGDEGRARFAELLDALDLAVGSLPLPAKGGDSPPDGPGRK